MSCRRLMGAIAAIALLVPAASSAQQFTYSIEDRPQFSLEIPEGWTLELRKPSDPTRPRLVALAPADDLWVGAWALEKVETFEQARNPAFPATGDRSCWWRRRSASWRSAS